MGRWREKEEKTHVLKTTSICGKTFVQWDGVTFVVLPIGDTWRNHPFLLFLRGRFSGRTPEDGWGRTRGTSRNLLVFEPRGLQWILHDFCHLYDSLLHPVRTILLPGCVSNERSLPVSIWHILWLRCLDFAVNELLESCSRLVGCCLDLIFGRTVHCFVTLIEIFPVRKWHEILELRLDDLPCSLTLLSNGIVANIAFAINLKG